MCAGTIVTCVQPEAWGVCMHRRGVYAGSGKGSVQAEGWGVCSPRHGVCVGGGVGGGSIITSNFGIKGMGTPRRHFTDSMPIISIDGIWCAIMWNRN